MNIIDATPENFLEPQATVEPFAEHPTLTDPKPNPIAAADLEPTPAAAPKPTPQPAMVQQVNQMEARQIQFMAYPQEQYTKLYDYLGELMSSNPETTTILQWDEGVFKRLYICMQAMKDDFKVGCRSIICLDGCHLKGHYGGHLLAAVGIDANDYIYSIAYAIVEAETESSWC
ncbi:hypothetical protein V6N13_107072 [Hibiscus sabdariffa]